MTKSELADFSNDFSKAILGDKESISIDGVFLKKAFKSSLTFSMGNARGCIFPNNGYRGHQPEGKDYYPLALISPSYSNEHKYCPTCEPNVVSIVSAIKSSWRSFTKS